MRKNLLLLLTFYLSLFSVKGAAQNLNPGDIIVIGLAADTGSSFAVDEFSWVPLVDIPTGTKIYFTDAGWNTASNEFMGAGDLGEILFRFVAPELIPAGKVMTVTEAFTPLGYTVLKGTKCGQDGTLSLPNAGDQITVFQSDEPENASFQSTNFRAIFSVTNSTIDWASMTSTTAVMKQGSDADNQSNLVPGLNSSTSIAVGNGPGPSDEADNVRYVGITQGTRAEILAAVTNYANWHRHNDNGNMPDLVFEANGWTARNLTQYIVTLPNPTLQISSTAPALTNLTSIPLTFSFNKAVIGFDVNDITVNGGYIQNLEGSGAFYTANLIPTINGEVQVTVAANVATTFDAFGNLPANFSIVSDKIRPTVEISWQLSSPTMELVVPLTITFSKPVTGFVQGDITVTGGSLANFGGSGTEYTVDFISNGSSGTKTINIPANVANDAAGNLNFAAAQFSYSFLNYCSITTTWNSLFWTNGDPVANQPALIAADYIVTQNLSACKLTISNGATVTVLSGVDLYITGQIDVRPGSTLIIESNANIIQSDNITNTGNIILKRNATMKRLDYVYWSSPVSGQNLYNFSPLTLSNRFYEIDELSNNFVTPVTSNFVTAKGYVIRAPNHFPPDFTPAVFSGVFTGTPNNGQITTPVTRYNKGYNLIGNPYPSPISADAFLAENPGTIYFYTHMTEAGGGSNYAVYNGTGAAAPAGGEVPNGKIQTAQGFLFNPVSAGNAVFTNSMRSGDHSDQFYRASNENKHRLWISLYTGDTMMNQTLIGYVPGATDDVDLATDGPLNFSGSSISSRIDNNNYVIQGRALPFQETDVVPLHFKAQNEGLFQLKLDDVDGLFADGQPVYLEDLQTQIIHNLTEGPYSFTSAAGDFAERFAIRYQYTALGIPHTAIENAEVLIYKEDGILTVTSGKDAIKSIDVYDIGGRLIYSNKEVAAAEAKLTEVNVQSQILIVKVSTESATVTKKVAY